MTVTFTGAKEIDAVLREMPLALSHQVLGQANIDAARPLIDKEHLLAPVGETGNLAESIGAYRVSLKSASVLGEVRVGPRRKGGYKGFHGHLIEFGFRTRSKGKGKPFVQAHPFAKPAFDATKGEIERGITTAVAKVVLRTMKRHIKG